MTMLVLNDFVAIRAALGRRAADAKFLEVGRPNERTRPDSDDLAGGASGLIETVTAAFHITYEDRGGFMSERAITIRRIERRAAGFYVHAICHLCSEPRLFAAERIQEGYDLTTGEVFTDAAGYFADHPLFHSPRNPEAAAIQNCRYEINLLTVVGAADGMFDPDEQDALLIHVFDRNEHLTLDEGLLRSLLSAVSPDEQAFNGSLYQMTQMKAGDPRALKRSLRRMVDADGVIAPEEIRFVEEIERRLSV